MQSALYLGRVRHRRLTPRAHQFSYPLFMVYLDLQELDTVFRGRWFWSRERANIASFRRTDYAGPATESLQESIRKLVSDATGARPAGPIRLLTHLRYFGYCFNPVSFYYCFDAAGTRVETIVAEITNTPWKERHCYVLSGDGRPRGIARWQFGKVFHVSPFMPMDMQYDWRFSAPGEALAVHMNCDRDGARVFDASMAMERRAMTAGNMAWALARFPFMTLRVVAAIHWQALRLWLKRVPVHTHPGKLAAGHGQSPAGPSPLV